MIRPLCAALALAGCAAAPEPPPERPVERPPAAGPVTPDAERIAAVLGVEARLVDVGEWREHCREAPPARRSAFLAGVCEVLE